MPSLNSKSALLAGAVALAVVLGVAGFRLDGLAWSPGAVYSDAATSHYPAALFLRQSFLEDGQFPLWREWFMAGAPFAANPLNKTAYPLQWAGLLLDPVAFLNMSVVLHLVLAGWGMWRWSCELGLGLSDELVSALAYMLAPRLLTGLGAGHLDLIYAAAWWPWLMMAAMRLGRSAAWQDVLWCALFAALLVLADVRLALYALPTAAIAFGVAWWRAGKPRRALWFGLMSAALAGGLALAVIAPLVGWSPWMNRGAQTAAEAAAYSLGVGNLPGVLFPLAAGSLETVTYLGLATLILALVGAWKLPKSWRWALLAGLVLVILWAFGPNTPLWALLAGQGGLLAWFRVPARIWYLVALIAAPLAGLGIETLLRVQPRPKEGQAKVYRWYRLAAFGLLVASALTGLALLTIPAASASGLHILLAGVSTCIVLLLMLAGRLRGRTLYWAFVALLLLDAALGARAWIEWRPLQPWLDSFGAVIGFLREDGAARVYSPDYSLPQEVAASAGIRLFGGVDPFQIAGVTEAVLQAGGISSSSYSVVVPPMLVRDGEAGFNRETVPNSALLAEWDVSHVIAGYPIEAAGLELVDVVNEVYVYRNAGYEARTPPGAAPGWPAGWPRLPDAATVARLNRMTEGAWQASMALLAGVAALLAVSAARNGRRKSL
ncbi:MAG: hypothetical protein JNL34_14125 [Anaerolineae bacterium]|nr:hypothetical protein [Anaerolineae bacterium]